MWKYGHEFIVLAEGCDKLFERPDIAVSHFHHSSARKATRSPTHPERLPGKRTSLDQGLSLFL